MMDAAIEVEDLSFAYRGAAKPTLRHVDLTFGVGELSLVTGVSGCGKSTLAYAVAGLIPSQIEGQVRGRVHCAGRPIGSVPVHEAAQSVGLVFQNPNLQLFHQRVESEVAFGPENLTLPGPEIRARVDRALAATGISDLRRAGVPTLSGGQKQRTAIAATLAMGSSVLVLDEPLSDLDPVGAQEVMTTLRRLATDEGVSVVLIEHRVDEVVAWCDRVVLMDDGVIVVDRPARSAFANRLPWTTSGVGLPDMVRVADAFPDLFAGATPLSVAETAAVLVGQAPTLSLAERLGSDGDPHARRPSSATTAAVSWEHVGLRFGSGEPVLDDVSLSVETGSWTAIVGANGSGKTSLVHTAVGLQPPQHGRVRLFDKAVDYRHIGAQAGTAALLLQAADEMLFSTTVAGELGFGFEHRRDPTPAPSLDLATVTSTFGFTGLEETSPWELSQGGRQRLVLASLLVGAPGVLILDEPTTGQDNEHRRAFMSLLDDVRATTDMTLVMVTHDMRSVANRAERIVVLGDGLPRLDGTPREVFARHDELAGWGVLPPPVARLQHELLADRARWVALDVDELLGLMGADRRTIGSST